MYNKIIKRIFDMVFSLILIIILSPVLLITAFLLSMVNRGKIFFTQERPGYKEKVFNIIKFKTMTDKADELGQLFPDNDRITKFGKFIRATSIDELPQLFNIFMGEMSFIGPRPLLIEYLLLYNNEQKRRHEMKPGISGWAQVNGRNLISWKQKFEYDIWYVDNISFKLDLKILLLTIRKVLKQEGINSTSHLTMGKFKGE